MPPPEINKGYYLEQQFQHRHKFNAECDVMAVKHKFIKTCCCWVRVVSPESTKYSMS